jgi:hypothetical protein
MIRLIISFLLLLGLTVSRAQADELLLKENAPERYVVVKGDTLWDIAGKFLNSPWKWPEIWQLNREQIKDPHWIYPGDTVVLDRSGATPRLMLERAGRMIGANSLKLGPQVRIGEIESGAIPSIPASAINPFLSRPLVIDENGLEKSPHIVATEDSRVVIGAGDKAYAEGIPSDETGPWQVYRPSKALRDPDTDRIIAHEALYLGEALVRRFGDPSTIEILRSRYEINRGDHLLRSDEEIIINYAPHSPEKRISGRIISAYEGVNEVARNAIIAINLGKKNGMEIGHVLTAYRNGAWVDSKLEGRRQVKLPEERVGLIFVFRVYDNISYALVMQSSRQLQTGDVVRTPGTS